MPGRRCRSRSKAPVDQSVLVNCESGPDEEAEHQSVRHRRLPRPAPRQDPEVGQDGKALADLFEARDEDGVKEPVAGSESVPSGYPIASATATDRNSPTKNAVARIMEREGPPEGGDEQEPDEDIAVIPSVDQEGLATSAREPGQLPKKHRESDD